MDEIETWRVGDDGLFLLSERDDPMGMAPPMTRLDLADRVIRLVSTVSRMVVYVNGIELMLPATIHWWVSEAQTVTLRRRASDLGRRITTGLPRETGIVDTWHTDDGHRWRPMLVESDPRSTHGWLADHLRGRLKPGMRLRVGPEGGVKEVVEPERLLDELYAAAPGTTVILERCQVEDATRSGLRASRPSGDPDWRCEDCSGIIPEQFNGAPDWNRHACQVADLPGMKTRANLTVATEPAQVVPGTAPGTFRVTGVGMRPSPPFQLKPDGSGFEPEPMSTNEGSGVLQSVTGGAILKLSITTNDGRVYTSESFGDLVGGLTFKPGDRLEVSVGDQAELEITPGDELDEWLEDRRPDLRGRCSAEVIGFRGLLTVALGVIAWVVVGFEIAKIYPVSVASTTMILGCLGVAGVLFVATAWVLGSEGVHDFAAGRCTRCGTHTEGTK